MKFKKTLLIGGFIGFVVIGIAVAIGFRMNHKKNLVKYWGYTKINGIKMTEKPPFGKWPYAYKNELKIYAAELEAALYELNDRLVQKFRRKYRFNTPVWTAFDPSKPKMHTFTWKSAPVSFYAFGQPCSMAPHDTEGVYGFWENIWDEKSGKMKNKAIYICEKKLQKLMKIRFPNKAIRHYQERIKPMGVLLHEGAHAIIGERHLLYGNLMMAGIRGHSFSSDAWLIIEKTVKLQMLR